MNTPGMCELHGYHFLQGSSGKIKTTVFE